MLEKLVDRRIPSPLEVSQELGRMGVSRIDVAASNVVNVIDGFILAPVIPLSEEVKNHAARQLDKRLGAIADLAAADQVVAARIQAERASIIRAEQIKNQAADSIVTTTTKPVVDNDTAVLKAEEEIVDEAAHNLELETDARRKLDAAFQDRNPLSGAGV